MHENPRPTEIEQEQVPERIEDEEEMRGPNESDPDPPVRSDDGGEEP